MQWVASTLHTTSEHGVSSITTADAAHLGCQQSTELTPTGRFKCTRSVSREGQNLVSACVPSHFKRSLQLNKVNTFSFSSHTSKYYSCKELEL